MSLAIPVDVVDQRLVHDAGGQLEEVIVRAAVAVEFPLQGLASQIVEADTSQLLAEPHAEADRVSRPNVTCPVGVAAHSV